MAAPNAIPNFNYRFRPAYSPIAPNQLFNTTISNNTTTGWLYVNSGATGPFFATAGPTGPTGATGNVNILNPGANRVLTSQYPDASAESNLTFDDENVTLLIGADVPTSVPAGINNLIISGNQAHSEMNTVCYSVNGQQQSSIVQHFGRGSYDSPADVQQDDIMGQYFVRGLVNGGFMNTAFINVRADYDGAATGAVGGRMLFRTRGDISSATPSSYGYPRMDITNQGSIRFYDTIGNIAYSFPQYQPSQGSVLCATGTTGQLAWQNNLTQFSARLSQISQTAGTNFLIQWNNIDVNSIGSLLYDSGYFINTSGQTKKFNFNMQVGMTGLSAGEGDIWFSFGGAFSGTNRYGQVGSFNNTIFMMSTSWTFILAPEQAVSTYVWCEHDYTVGGVVSGNSANYSTKITVSEVF